MKERVKYSPQRKRVQSLEIYKIYNLCMLPSFICSMFSAIAKNKIDLPLTISASYISKKKSRFILQNLGETFLVTIVILYSNANDLYMLYI